MALIKQSIYLFIVFIKNLNFVKTIIISIILILFIINSTVFANTYELFSQGINLEQSLFIFEARDKFLEAIENDPDNSGYLTHYAWFLQNHGFYEEASDVFNKLISITKDEKDMYFLYCGLGWEIKKLGKIQDSLTIYKNVLPLKHSDDSFIVAFAEIKENFLNKNLKKIEIIRSNLLKDPNNIKLKKDLFNLYLDIGEINKAISLASEILNIDSNDNFLHLQLARALSWIGEYKRSKVEYVKLISAIPNNAFLYYELACIEKSDGNISTAMEIINKSLSIYPNGVMTKKMYAELLAKKGDIENSNKILDSIQFGKNNRINGMFSRANILNICGKKQDANTLYKKVIEEYPYNADALWGIIETDRDLRNFDDLRFTIMKWKEIDSEDRLNIRDLLLPYYIPPNFEFKSEYYDNASKFTMRHNGLRFGFYVGEQTRLHAGYTFSNYHKDGFSDIKRQSVYAESKKLFSENIQLSGRIANNDYNNNNINTNMSLSLNYKPNQRLTSIWKYKHIDIIDSELPFGNPIYNYAIAFGAVGQNIRTDDYSVYLLYEPLSRFWFAGQIVYGKYSDNNIKRDKFIEVGYKVSEIPYIRASYNFFNLNYKNSSVFTKGGISDSAYYDPKDLKSHTAKIKINLVCNKILSYGIEESLAINPDNSGRGITSFIFADFNFNEKNLLRIDARWFTQDKGIDRVGDTDSFNAKNLTFSYEYRF